MTRRKSLLTRRRGYGTVGGFLIWLAAIAAFVASLIDLTTGLPTD
jgi:hypothetical protein